MKTVNVMFDAGTSELLGISYSAPRKRPYIAVPLSDLEEYPLACWELSEDQAEITLKADAGTIKESILTPVDDPVPTVDIKVSPIDFKLLFKPVERIKLNELRKTDPVLDDFLSIIDDPRLTQVDLGLQSIQDSVTECLTALVAAGAIEDQTQADKRKMAILTGVAQ